MVVNSRPASLFSDEAIRASYIRERSIREACAAIRFYSEKIDTTTFSYNDELAKPYYVPISNSFRPTLDSTLDHLRVHASALALAYGTDDKAERATYALAAGELDRLLDAYEEKKGNFSQLEIAASIRRNPHGITRLLHDVAEDKGVITFWKDHVTSRQTGKLSFGCERELESSIRKHFAKKRSVEDLIFGGHAPDEGCCR